MTQNNNVNDGENNNGYDKFDRLISWFAPTDRLFAEFESDTLDYEDKNRRRIFVDNGSLVLFVAHLDTVHKPQYVRKKGANFHASGLDDRLGCWIAYTLSKQLNADLLLCDNEEIGQSTAKWHICKEYNWIAEFDRAGDDVVTYDLDSKLFRNALEESFTINYGMFSDISFLRTFACCVNVGIGYKYAHSKYSYADLSVTQKQITKFIAFFRRYEDTAFERDFYYNGAYGNYGTPVSNKYGGYGNYNYNKCELCDSEGTSIYTRIFCEECLEEIVNNYYEGCYGTYKSNYDERNDI
jgi:hypothetical protein